MRAQRLVQIVLLLQVGGRLTVRDLAARLEVSARTVQRDLDSLSSAGVPVYAARGRGGGWALASDYRTRLNGLGPAEAAALFVGTTHEVVADLGLSEAVASATNKLFSAVPSHARGSAELARERVLVDHGNWSLARESTEWLGVLQHAVWNEERVSITYRGGSAFVISPLGLVAKKYAWYVVARRQDGEIRTYKVARITSASLTGEQFSRPPGFDLASHWASSNEAYFTGLRDCPVRLRVRNSVGHRLRWAQNAVIEEISDLGDGWSEVRMTFEKAYETRVFLLGLAGDVVVLEPAEIRIAMIEAARSLLAAHADL